jgi:hypothetical protein
MTKIRTATRLLLAALTVGLGASFATAKDKTPAKPHAAPAAKPHAAPAAKHEAPKVQSHQDLKNPNNFSFGAQPTKGVKKDAKVTPEGKKPQKLKIEGIDGESRAPRKTNPALATNSGNVPPVEATATAKPMNLRSNTAGAQSRNDAGTRSGGSLVLSGAFDVVKGVKDILTGNTEGGFKKVAEGAKRIQTGTNGDPKDNGKPLNEGEGGEGGESGGEGGNEGGGN